MTDFVLFLTIFCSFFVISELLCAISAYNFFVIMLASYDNENGEILQWRKWRQKNLPCHIIHWLLLHMGRALGQGPPSPCLRLLIAMPVYLTQIKNSVVLLHLV